MDKANNYLFWNKIKEFGKIEDFKIEIIIKIASYLKKIKEKKTKQNANN